MNFYSVITAYNLEIYQQYVRNNPEKWFRKDKNKKVEEIRQNKKAIETAYRLKFNGFFV